jgi:hypothetical protein
MVAGGWLLYVWGLENYRSADELRTRGKTAVARELSKREYSYEVDGVTHHGKWTGRERPANWTVTYLPENHATHQLGTVQPEPLGVGGVVGLVALAGLYVVFALFFFLACMLSPQADGNPTTLGVWLIVGLATVQAAVAFPLLTLAQSPFLVVLTQYVPAFVAATVAVVVAVRLFAWRQGIALSHTPSNTPAAGATWTMSHDADQNRVWTNEKGEQLTGEQQAHAEAMLRLMGGPQGSEQAEQEAVKGPPAPDLAGPVAACASLAAQEEQAQVEPQPADPGASASPHLACPTPASPSAPWYVTPCAALGGAAACLLESAVGVAVLHLIAFTSKGAGCLVDTLQFFTTRDSILFGLIVCTVAAAFGAIRGVAHAESLKQRPWTWRGTFLEAGGMAANDLANLRRLPESFEHAVGIIGALILAPVLAAPAIIVVLVLWFR